MAVAGKYPMVPLNSVVKNIKDLESVPIRTGTYPTVFVRDVGQVVDGTDIVTSYALVDGRRALFVNPAFTHRLVGVTREESAHLLEMLFEEISAASAWLSTDPVSVSSSPQSTRVGTAISASRGVRSASAIAAALYS